MNEEYDEPYDTLKEWELDHKPSKITCGGTKGCDGKLLWYCRECGVMTCTCSNCLCHANVDSNPNT